MVNPIRKSSEFLTSFHTYACGMIKMFLASSPVRFFIGLVVPAFASVLAVYYLWKTIQFTLFILSGLLIFACLTYVISMIFREIADIDLYGQR